MLTSDFLHAQSTQELLFLVFSSEIGLLSVSHPEVQLQALSQAFSSLQTTIVENLRNGRESYSLRLSSETVTDLPPVPMSYRTDAAYFQALYGQMGRWAPEKMLLLHVYPLIGEMVLKNPKLREATLALLKGHIQRWGAAVGERVRGSLFKFDLTPLVPELR
jgi:hypothetical protein